MNQEPTHVRCHLCFDTVRLLEPNLSVSCLTCDLCQAQVNYNCV